MSNHLRHCPKHRKPLPCPHCAMIAAAPTPAESVPEPATAESVKRGRGRPPKHATEEDRKAADAARKRDERLIKKAEEIIQENPDHRGIMHGETSGGYDSEKMSLMVGKMQAAEATGLGTDRDPDVPEINQPDRRRVSTPPIDYDEQKNNFAETESFFVTLAFRRERGGLRSRKRKCSWQSEHARWAKEQKDSPRKVYCGKCGKLLVNPFGKVKAIFPDAGQNEVSPSL